MLNYQIELIKQFMSWNCFPRYARKLLLNNTYKEKKLILSMRITFLQHGCMYCALGIKVNIT